MPILRRCTPSIGVNEVVRNFDVEKLVKFLEFRVNFLQEELDELKDGKSADDVVDALIDLCVVAIGTLDAYDVDAYTAWDRVLEANMNKEVGVKEGRPNPLRTSRFNKANRVASPLS